MRQGSECDYVRTNFIALFVVMAFLSTIPIVWAGNGDESLQGVIDSRKNFISKFCRLPELLKEIEVEEKSKEALSFLEPSPLSHYFWPQKFETPREHLKNVFQLVHERHVELPPLYLSNELHCPDRYLNVYGCGASEDLAQVVAGPLSDNRYTFWIIEGIKGVFFRVPFDGSEHDINLHGEAFKSASVLREIEPNFSKSELLPNAPLPQGTERRYLKELFVVGTDGHQKEDFVLSRYEKTMANFLLLTPLHGRNELAIQNYFPIVAAFVSLPSSEAALSDKELPLVKTEMKGKVRWLPVERMKTDGNEHAYFNATHLLAHLSSHPQRRLELARLGSLGDKASLVTVHTYCRKNALFNAKNPLKTRQMKADGNISPIVKRKEFLEQFCNRRSLLKAQELPQKQLASIHNDSPRTKKLLCSEAFPSTENIVNELKKRPAGKKRAIALYEYIRKKVVPATPLFNNDHQHWPSRLFSTYGCGWCDDGAIVFYDLAKRLGMKARVWYLQGHVIAEVAWDDDWHLFDPTGFGFVTAGDKILSLDELIDLAPEGVMNDYDDAVLSRNDNFIGKIVNKPQPEPCVELLPGETRHFLKDPFVLTTDGAMLIRFRIHNVSWQEYENIVANQVRDIPLRKVLDGDELKVEDYFPMSAIQIVYSPKEGDSLRKIKFPQVAISGTRDSWFSGEELEKGVRDYSAALAHLEETPSFSVKIRRLKPILESFPECRLLITLVYCPQNAGDLKKLELN